jgi:hypothetical protein
MQVHTCNIDFFSVFFLKSDFARPLRRSGGYYGVLGFGYDSVIITAGNVAGCGDFFIEEFAACPPQAVGRLLPVNFSLRSFGEAVSLTSDVG